jgi:hypothetical protein
MDPYVVTRLILETVCSQAKPLSASKTKKPAAKKSPKPKKKARK